MANPILRLRRVFAFAIESTAGTPVALTGDTFFCFDAVMTPEISMHDRQATGSLSKLASIPAGRKAKFTFSVELAGGGSTTLPAWNAINSCCGLLTTGSVLTCTSSTANYSTCTIGLYEDGRFKTMSGCMGKWSLEGEYGKPLMIKYEFEGVWQGVTTVAMPALPAFTTSPPRFAGATLTLGSYTPQISKFSLDSGNKITVVEDVTQASAYSRAIVVDRNVKGKMDPIAVTPATYDFYGLWQSGTSAALSLTVGSVTDNTIAISIPYCQTTNVTDTNREDLVVDDLDFMATVSTTADTELSITFS
jgi:hypothetical protein